MNRKLSLIALFAFGAAGAALAQSAAAPSLAEVARQTRADKKKVKVFTDDNLPRNSTVSVVGVDTPSHAVDAASAADGKTGATAGDAKKTDTKPSDQAPAKASSGSEMKSQLDRYTQQRDSWKKSVQRYQELLQNESDKFRRETYQEALDIDRHNVELYQQKIDQLQEQISKSSQDAPASAK